jgi:type I restriction enzyme M protein
MPVGRPARQSRWRDPLWLEYPAGAFVPRREGGIVTDLQDFSRTLFAAADQLWTNSNLRPDQYAQPVLALIALRQMEAKFEAVHAKLAPKYKGRLKPAPADY